MMKNIMLIVASLMLTVFASHATAKTAQTSNTVESSRADSASSSIHWDKYNVDVFQRAKNSHHPVILFAMASTCHFCQQMSKTTFKNSMVIQMINENYYPVILQADNNSETADKYGIDVVPTIIFFDVDGNVRKSYSGYIDNAAMMQHLKEMLPNTI